MITMDLKGIMWVGHVYQKFESMCLEVEEVMYQDTVKYVENQVQTVGASVKRFYSDMMQDLLLPSSLEPVKTVAASDIPIEKHAGTLKRSNVCLREDSVQDDGEQLTEDSEVIADFNDNAARASSTSQLHSVDNVLESCSGNSMERASSDVLSGENNNWTTLDKLNVENPPVAEKSSEAASLENNFSQDMSSFCANANANHEVSGHQIPATLTPVSVPDDSDFIEEGCNEIESATCSTPEISTDGLHLVDSIGKKEVEIRSSPSDAGSAGSNGGSSNTGMVNFVGCSGNDDIQHKEFSNRIKFASCTGQSNNSTMDNSGNSTVAQKEIESVQQLDKTRVDESCILVNEAELYFHRQREGKHKPYKKKIRDAISSRMRSARKKEYERLALWYGDNVKSDKDCDGSSMLAIRKEDTRRSLTHDVMDSDWELL